ncbi:MAG: universal stress protein [Leptospirales bacterium]|nr:universal stress protein [Leptospirales bacterium]
MLKRILVALDPSTEAHHAQQRALALAAEFKAEILALGIVDEPGITEPELVPPGAAEFHQQKVHTLLQRGEERAQQLIKNFSDQCQQAGVRCTAHKLHGKPAEVIEEEAFRCDLFVSAQHPHLKHITQDEACDTLPAALRKLARPTLIVPSVQHPGNGVMIATDGSPQAARTIQLFALLGLANGRQATVVSIHDDQSRASAQCTAAAEYLRSHGVAVTESPTASREPPMDVLLDLANAARPEAVVMGAFGVSGLREFFFGSVTQKMLEKCPSPIFVYH